MVMDSDTPSTARGLLMLMLRPIPTFFMEDLDTTDTSDMDTLDMPDSDTADTTSASRLLSRSFSEPSAESWTKMDCYQFEVPFTSAAVSVLPSLETNYGSTETAALVKGTSN